MSCNHMYVTDVDKALNMCGLCGVTFDEWREGKVSTFKDGVTAERERIIKLLEEMPMMIYYAVAHNGRILDKPCSPVVIEREAAIALIEGEGQ